MMSWWWAVASSIRSPDDRLETNREEEIALKEFNRIQPVVKKFSVGDQPNDTAYWQTQPYHLRLAALEDIRREYHRWKYGAEPQLQRVYSIVKR
jgi:hypothetical protein